MTIVFLEGATARKGRWRDESAATAGRHGFTAHAQWTGQGRDALNVAYATADTRPTVTAVRGVWMARHGRAAAPLLLVVAYSDPDVTRAFVCGPKGDAPPVVDMDFAQAERIASAALDEPSRHAAERFLLATLHEDIEELPGLRNQGLLATHELAVGVPRRPDWLDAQGRASDLLGLRDQELIRSLGFTIEQRGHHRILRDVGDSSSRAIAVFLQPGEQPDAPSAKYGSVSPVTHGLNHADRENLRWVVTVRGGCLRLYSTATAGAVGQRGRTETYVEVNLPLLPTDRAAYLDLLFSARALADGGTVDEIREASEVYTTGLAARLRERVYDEVVPRLGQAVADTDPDGDLDAHYRTGLTILFRLLFLAYAEHQRLLPYGENDDYTAVSLTDKAKRLARIANTGGDLGFDNPLTPEVEPDTDQDQTDLWDACKILFHAVDKGHPRLGIPPYNGGLFSTDPEMNPAGPVIEELSLPNAVFGPALFALLIDQTPDGDVGPIDFRSLSVREFGTIYEGLLESELARATTDLALVRRNGQQVYEPTSNLEQADRRVGDVYLHNRSGARKATGSYFTKQFAVQHLLDNSVVPALREHLREVAQLLEDGKESDAAKRLFEFRVADISMGSGHFLTAAVDTIEVQISQFLADHHIPPVVAELDRLKAVAERALPKTWVGEIEQGALRRRLIARRCVYGVDVNPLSVELARVSMWIHTFVPGLPLSFLDHNLVVGDSLAGIGTIHEGTEELVSDDAQASLFDDPVVEALRAAEEPLRRLATIADANSDDIEAAREAAREARQAIRPVEDLFDLAVAARLGEATRPMLTSISELETLEVGHARTIAQNLNVLHFPIRFPEIFLSERPGFDVIIGNPPWQETVVEELGFWALRFPGLKSLSAGDQQREIERLRKERPDLVAEYEAELAANEALRVLLLSGPYPGMGTGDPDLYKAFAWRFLRLVRDGGSLGIVLPRSVFATKGSAQWRNEALGSSDAYVVTTRNTREWVFDDVNPGYTFCFVSLTNVRGVSDPILRLAGRYDSPQAYEEGMRRGPATLPLSLLAERDEDLALPDLNSDRDLNLFSTLITVPGLGDDRSDFTVRAVTDFHATNDRKKGFLTPDGDTPVYNHLNIGHFAFAPSEGEFTRCNFNEAVTELQRRKRSGVRRSRSAFSEMFQTYGQSWLDDASSVPVLNPRIAFRDVIHATNPRKVWAALLPSGTVLTNKAPYLVFPKGDLGAQAWLLAMLNSSVCDWWGHLFVNLNLNYFILYGLPVPTWQPDDPRSRRAIQLGATLAVNEEGDYGDWADLALDGPHDRDDAIAELDAIASLAYGINDELLDLIWNDDASLRPPLDRVRKFREEWT